LHVTQIPLHKGPFAVTEVVFPHPYKGVSKAKLSNFLNVFKEALAPSAQGPRVMGRDVFKVKDPQVGDPCNGVGHGRDGRDTTSRENVPFDEVNFLFMAFKNPIGDGDGLKQHHPIFLQSFAAAAEKGVKIVVTNRLDHLNGDRLIVFSFQISVIFEKQRYLI
jgi:hypothetical protein